MQDNKELQLAWKIIENTGVNLFLTGKAGTGKTTFLRELKEKSPKRMVVLAPTGIAAINAQGVTIHSFLQLPFAPFLPNSESKSAKHQYNFNKDKLNIIRSLDLIVIDEVSMVRADLLDAIDDVLRRVRRSDEPFGGVQLLLIGDLQQLPPVVQRSEEQLLRGYYDTFYFFGSNALRNTDYRTIELNKIYRQNDSYFISLLNQIRQGNITDDLVEKLNKRYYPDFNPDESEGYIRLVTHNAQANIYNQKKLDELSSDEFTFVSSTKNKFPESMYPADEKLVLKEGAQVMFLRNDASPEKRFYNGKLATITRLSATEIWVTCEGENSPFLLAKEEWTNAKYELNKKTNEIVEVIEGTFSQYPLRLAWAITIHKSQGLTFEKAIIDAEAAFAHGQVYVALSRCKTLEGLVLDSPINRYSFVNDNQINQFNKEQEQQEELTEKSFQKLELEYLKKLLNDQFGMETLYSSFNHLDKLLNANFYTTYPQLLKDFALVTQSFDEKIQKVSRAFKAQYYILIDEYLKEQTNFQFLQERIIKAANYFYQIIKESFEDLISRSASVQSDNKKISKQVSQALYELKEIYHVKLETLNAVKTEGFSATLYLKTKTNSALNFAKSEINNNRRRKKEPVSLEVSNPRLFNELIEWRKRTSVEKKIPAYCVVQQRALIGIVNNLPTTKKELLEVPYLGRKSVDSYGEELLKLIKNYL